MLDFNEAFEQASLLLRRAEVLTSSKFTDDLDLLMQASLGRMSLVLRGSKIYLNSRKSPAKTVDDCAFWMFGTPEDALNLLDAIKTVEQAHMRSRAKTSSAGVMKAV